MNEFLKMLTEEYGFVQRMNYSYPITEDTIPYTHSFLYDLKVTGMTVLCQCKPKEVHLRIFHTPPPEIKPGTVYSFALDAYLPETTFLLGIELNTETKNFYEQLENIFRMFDIKKIPVTPYQSKLEFDML